jgi:putative ABC transport system permease protein
MMLKGAGLVGLLVAGIAVAGTLRVMLARRTLEIAVLKTAGFSRGRILRIFIVELGLLGAAGGVVGAVAGAALSYPLVVLLGRSGTLLMDWRPDLLVLGGGVLVGALTAVIFGADAALRASLVRPAALLRDAAPPQRGLAVGAYAAVGLTYAAVAGVIMGSPLVGAAVVLGAAVSLAALGGLLALACAGVVRLPLPGPGDLELARQWLQREIRRAALPLVAIFAGTLCIAISGSALISAYDRVTAQLRSTGGYNLLVQTASSDEAAVRAALSRAGAEGARVAVRLGAEVRAAGAPVESLRAVEARPATEATWDLQVFEGAWTGEPGTALAPALYFEGPAGWRVGDTVEVAVAGGPGRPLRIAGFYNPAAVGPMGGTRDVLIVAREATPEAMAEGTLRVVSAAAPERLEEVADAVGAALPYALVLSAADLSEVQARSYLDLFSFVAAVAGLAFVAGAVLIANSVGLTMVERRREIAVLKAVGFSRGRVLRLVALEHSLLGLVGGGAGLLAAWAALALINVVQPRAELSLAPLVAAGVGVLAVGIAILSASLSARRPVSLRPLAVLREE